MRLVVAGEWLGREGLCNLRIKNISVAEDIEALEGFSGFVLLSYSLSSKLLNLNLKKKGILPPVVMVELEDWEPRPLDQLNPRPYKLNLKDVSLGPEDYKRAVLKVKEHIEAGDIYQLNLTSRFTFEGEEEHQKLFLHFYRAQPVPYAFFLDTGDFCLISGSMELFLEKRDKLLVSKPIKGTARNREELASSRKDRAENLMITDMVRNDIGRVAETGSVRVRELFKIEGFRTLYQMHSRVEGRSCASSVEILRATFPPASVTGAPKRKAVEIIDGLEPHAREYYCGCGGFLFPNGDFRLSVLIRTAVAKGSRIDYYAGCGIVWDSSPEGELEELLLKVKAFYKRVKEEL